MDVVKAYLAYVPKKFGGIAMDKRVFYNYRVFL